MRHRSGIETGCAAALALAAGLWSAAGVEAQESRTYECRPALAVFCRNIHVSCAGRTSIPTNPFSLRMGGERATITFGGNGPDLPARVTGGTDRIVHPVSGRDWIRIEPDGRYSHRIYRNGGSAMSYGTCRRSG